MKTQLLILTLLTSTFVTQIQAQNRTTINAKNFEISDNLDLRAVASIFGDSDNLQDFERRLNNPKFQISNLDLNDDNQVDYLRVIESVENRTHVIIIQSVLDRDLYQDIATIEVEKDNYSNVHVQVVGNVYMYGRDYIYEPVYYNTPQIYASFWVSNYRPYYSSWNWNFYPSFYYTWSPFPVFRYRHNINSCLNPHNQYNYVNNRRSCNAISIYNSRRFDGYEREHPEYSFSRRNSNIANRYELDQKRNSGNGYKNGVGHSQNRSYFQRDYSQNRNESPRFLTPQSEKPQRDYSQDRSYSQRNYSQNRTESPGVLAPQREYSQDRSHSQRDYSQNRIESPRANISQRDYSQNRISYLREENSQRSETSRGNTSNRNENRRM